MFWFLLWFLYCGFTGVVIFVGVFCLCCRFGFICLYVVCSLWVLWWGVCLAVVWMVVVLGWVVHFTEDVVVVLG